jgi:hypothetical protein
MLPLFFTQSNSDSWSNSYYSRVNEKKEVRNVVKEIKFTQTGLIRAPRAGEWFLGTKGIPIQAVHDFQTTQFPILKMEVIEENAESFVHKVA